MLSRGYGIVSSRGKAVSSYTELSVGDAVILTLSDGEIEATVEKASAKSVSLNKNGGIS